MPLGIVMVSVSKSSTFIVSKNGQKLPELMKDGDVQVNFNTCYNFYYYEFKTTLVNKPNSNRFKRKLKIDKSEIANNLYYFFERSIFQFQVVNLYEKIPHMNTDVSAVKLWIQLMKEAVKLRIRVEKFAEKSSKLLPMFNASTNVLNFVILDPVLHV